MMEITTQMLAGLGNDEMAAQNCVTLCAQCEELPEYLLQVGTDYISQFVEKVVEEDDVHPIQVVPAAMATWYVRLLEVGIRLGREMERTDNAAVAEFQVPDTLPEDFS